MLSIFHAIHIMKHSNLSWFQGYFKPSVAFYVLNIGQLILLEVLAYVILVQFGTGWLPYWLSIFCLATVQVCQLCAR